MCIYIYIYTYTHICVRPRVLGLRAGISLDRLCSISVGRLCGKTVNDGVAGGGKTVEASHHPHTPHISVWTSPYSSPHPHPSPKPLLTWPTHTSHPPQTAHRVPHPSLAHRSTLSTHTSSHIPSFSPLLSHTCPTHPRHTLPPSSHSLTLSSPLPFLLSTL
jgi:hypothetical protein